jgi:predicted Rossmann fold flavoprotein
MAAIWAGRTAPLRIIALDGAKKLGAKILVAGGGRCNVTHDHVDDSAYAGSSPTAIRNVLRSFDVPRTIAFFRDLGVELKREDTGKLFPVTDDAHTVLDALLTAARAANVEIRHPWRVTAIDHHDNTFILQGSDSSTGAAPDPLTLRARRLILATGGMSLPKTGSDGGGYSLARTLGHSITPRVFPSLVPLTLPQDHILCTLSGVAAPATLELRAGTGKKLRAFSGPVLCTHFGISGPAVLDMSRYWLDAAQAPRTPAEPAPQLVINWIPETTADKLDAELVALAASEPHTPLARWAAQRATPPLPERLARAICEAADLDPAQTVRSLSRQARRALAQATAEMHLPISGSRGFTFAEVTAGGVPLSEVRLATMESRPTPGLHLCGEICDVDGRVGGYNFQWAWSSGYLAGVAAARGVHQP